MLHDNYNRKKFTCNNFIKNFHQKFYKKEKKLWIKMIYQKEFLNNKMMPNKLFHHFKIIKDHYLK